MLKLNGCSLKENTLHELNCTDLKCLKPVNWSLRNVFYLFILIFFVELAFMKVACIQNDKVISGLQPYLEGNTTFKHSLLLMIGLDRFFSFKN